MVAFLCVCIGLHLCDCIKYSWGVCVCVRARVCVFVSLIEDEAGAELRWEVVHPNMLRWACDIAVTLCERSPPLSWTWNENAVTCCQGTFEGKAVQSLHQHCITLWIMKHCRQHFVSSIAMTMNFGSSSFIELFALKAHHWKHLIISAL